MNEPVDGKSRKEQMFDFIVEQLVKTGQVPHMEGMTRPVETFAFICIELVRKNRSPSLEDVARHLGVAKSRARDLVGELRHAGVVLQVPGAQRALVVPGLERRVAIEALRREGYTVDEDILMVRPSTPVQVPIVAVIDHRKGHDDLNQSAA